MVVVVPHVEVRRPAVRLVDGEGLAAEARASLRTCCGRPRRPSPPAHDRSRRRTETSRTCPTCGAPLVDWPSHLSSNHASRAGDSRCQPERQVRRQPSRTPAFDDRRLSCERVRSVSDPRVGALRAGRRPGPRRSPRGCRRRRSRRSRSPSRRSTPGRRATRGSGTGPTPRMAGTIGTGSVAASIGPDGEQVAAGSAARRRASTPSRSKPPNPSQTANQQRSGVVVSRLRAPRRAPARLERQRTPRRRRVVRSREWRNALAARGGDERGAASASGRLGRCARPGLPSGPSGPIGWKSRQYAAKPLRDHGTRVLAERMQTAARSSRPATRRRSPSTAVSRVP